MRLISWVDPNRGTRQTDDFGEGKFGALRARGGKNYAHKGLDLIAEVGDRVLAPFAGHLVAPGRAYADGNCDLRTIHLRNESMRCTLMYAKQLDALDSLPVSAGTQIGVAQDVASWHEAHSPGKKMTNHIHGEFYRLENGVWVLFDPSSLLLLP